MIDKSRSIMSVSIDPETRNEFEKFCSQVGIGMSTLFAVFAKTVVREQRIPFEIKLTPNKNSESERKD